jgi:hypothetical protein
MQGAAARVPVSSAGPYSGIPAALPLAGALVLALSRWLPIRFEYRENELGIVSPATLARYPHQQEGFWLAVGLAAGALAAFGLARALRCPAASAARVAALEALGAAGLLALLLLPTPIGAAACAACAGGAAALAARSRAAAAPAVSVPAPRPQRRSLARELGGAALALALVALLVPSLWVYGWMVWTGIADEQLVNDGFELQAEWGQHLAWANAIWHGGLPGRDFFTLYGPLYDLGLAGFWKLAGRSIPAFLLHWSLTRFAAWLGFLLLGRLLLRGWGFAWLLPLLLTTIELRIGLALFACVFLLCWLRSGRRAWCAAAGATAAASLLYSQEFGVALAATAALAFALRADARAALVFGAGLAALLLPFGVWLAREGALAPMLHDLVQYPRYMIAGYAKHPFPSLAAALPLALADLGGGDTLALRYGYALPAIALSALLLALPVSAVDPRRPLASLRAAAAALARDPERLALVLVAVFALISFRSALGRSSLHRSVACAAPAALLLAVAFERSAALWRTGGAARRLASWRLAALAGLVLLSGLAQQAEPFTLAARTADRVYTLATRGHHPQGAARTMRVVRWVQLHTEPGETLLFLPNNAAYYYLVDRSSPIRFVLGSQIVTEAHRREVLADLQRDPPRWLVWDPKALRADDLPDRLVFGEALMDWLEERYVVDTLLGTIEVRRWREADADPVVDSDS